MEACVGWRLCMRRRHGSLWSNAEQSKVHALRQQHRKSVRWKRAAVKPYACASRCEELGLDQLTQETGSFASLASILKRCGQNKALSDGKLVHAHIVKCRYDNSTFLGNWVVKMYGECGSIDDARAVFDRLPDRNLYSWTILIRAYAKNKRCREALDCFKEMRVKGLKPDFVAFLSAIDACAGMANLKEGLEIHAAIGERGLEGDVVVGTALVNMYGKCGSLENAHRVFARMPCRDVISWNAMIAACAQNGHDKEALDYFHEMQRNGIKPDRLSFISALNACGGLMFLEKGRKIHTSIVESRCEGDLFVETALISMYSKCGSLLDAVSVFGRMSKRDVISWNAMILAYALNGHCEEALECFDQMQLHGINPNHSTFVYAIDACASFQALKKGQEIHAAVMDYGFEGHVAVANALVNMYGKCGSLADARDIFCKMPQRDVSTWAAMIAIHTQNGRAEEGLNLFDQMQLEGIKPNYAIYGRALDACARMTDSRKGQEIFGSIVSNGLEIHPVVGTALINMYGKCGKLQDARNVFERMPERNVATWNVMIAACAQNGHEKEALDYFLAMQLEGMKPDTVTFGSAVSACGILKAHDKGQEIHAAILDLGFEGQLVLDTALINMYGKCGDLQHARSVFNQMPCRNIVSWTAMISAYSQNGYGKEALHCFHQIQLYDLKPDSVAFVCALDACASIAALEKGQEIHAAIVNSGYEGQLAVGNALVNMYGKCGSLQDAKSVFEKMPERDSVSWNAIVGACTQNGHANEALHYLHQMQLNDIKPDPVTFVCAVNACANLAVLDKGQEFHAAILDRGCEGQLMVGTALIDMYGKCGSLKDARNVFRRMPEHNVVSWTAMIAACAQNGHGEEALDWFFQMQVIGIVPDAVTFVCALGVCSNLLALEKGRDIHSSIMDNGCEGQVVVGNALINMYGRCNSLHDAQNVFDRMPQRDVVSWNAIITACTQTKKAKEALDYFHRMQLAGMQPDHVTFVCTLNACATLAALEKGKEIHLAIMNSRCGEETVGSALVNMYGKCGSLDDARNVFCQMLQRDVVSWNAMIAACAENGNDKEALDYFYQMQCEGIKPDQLTFLSILTACSHSGRADDGRQFFLSMTQDHGLTPKEEHELCLIDILGRAGHLEEAESLFNSIR